MFRFPVFEIAPPPTYFMFVTSLAEQNPIRHADGLGTGEVLVFYLPIRFFCYLAKLVIFIRSSRIPCIFFLEGGFKGIYLRERNFTLSYVVSEI